MKDNFIKNKLFKSAPKFWYSSDFSLFSRLLLPLSILYSFIVWARLKFLRKYNSSNFVICVGNLNIGGSGKTPIVIALKDLLKGSLKQDICFLSKGYKGALQEPALVDDSNNCKLFGDEPVMLSPYGDSFVSKNRVEGLKYIEKYFAVSRTVIMDDGLQNPKFEKDVSIVVINGSMGLGNGFCFPSGPLRQNLNTGLHSIDMVIIVGNDDNNIVEQVSACRPNLPIVYGKVVSMVRGDNCKVIAFSGLANNNKFFTFAQKCGFNVYKTIEFPDHYSYNSSDLEFLFKLSQRHEAELLTTEKDLVKISKQDRLKYGIKVLPIKMKFESRDVEIIKKVIHKKILQK